MLDGWFMTPLVSLPRLDRQLNLRKQRTLKLEHERVFVPRTLAAAFLFSHSLYIELHARDPTTDPKLTPHPALTNVPSHVELVACVPGRLANDPDKHAHTHAAMHHAQGMHMHKGN